VGTLLVVVYASLISCVSLIWSRDQYIIVVCCYDINGCPSCVMSWASPLSEARHYIDAQGCVTISLLAQNLVVLKYI